jgi:hypothetical protein
MRPRSGAKTLAVLAVMLTLWPKSKRAPGVLSHFERLKQAVIDCNTQYLEKIRQRELALAKDNATLGEQGGLQFKLNDIITSLDFDS